MAPTKNFGNVGRMVSIKSGDSIYKISETLKENGVIQNPSCFRLVTRIIGKDDSAKAGEYFFKHPLNCLEAVGRIVKGDHRLAPVQVTIREGLNVFEIAKLLANNVPSFNSEKFAEIAREKEGFLFPDTYHFYLNVSPETVLEAMENNFNEKIESIYEDLKLSGKPLDEIITMASIIEDEAVTSEDRRIVSGILWKRISMKMPLQVDAPFIYITGKGTFDLTKEDLEFDSPYNTYKNRGLPPTPINNPSLDSILAAIHPTETKYLYFISDKDGDMYYAKNFDEHQINRELYLGR